MKRFWVMVSCTFALILPAFACSPPHPRTVMEQFEYAEAVFEGIVFSEDVHCNDPNYLLPTHPVLCPRTVRAIVLNSVKGDAEGIVDIHIDSALCFYPIHRLMGRRTYLFLGQNRNGQFEGVYSNDFFEPDIELEGMPIEEFRRLTIDRPPIYMPNGDLISGGRDAVIYEGRFMQFGQRLHIRAN